jgi:hypothetical protein
MARHGRGVWSAARRGCVPILPDVSHARESCEFVLGNGDTEGGQQVRAVVVGQLVDASGRSAQEVKNRQPFEERSLPAGAARGNRTELLHAAGHSRRLGVDQLPRLGVEVLPTSCRGRRDSRFHPIRHPEMQLGHPVADAFETLIPPLGLSFRVHRLRFFRGGGFLLRPNLPASQPFTHPRRALGPRHGGRFGHIQKQQTQSVFAGKLAARARTLKCNLSQVHLRLIRLLPASLTLAPQGALVAATAHPIPDMGQALAARRGRWVRRQAEHVGGRE